MDRLVAPLIALPRLWAIPDIRGVPGVSTTLASRVDILVLVVVTLCSMWQSYSLYSSNPSVAACKKHAPYIRIGG
jgi:hypothetical protein